MTNDWPRNMGEWVNVDGQMKVLSPTSHESDCDIRLLVLKVDSTCDST